jgi:hypothetical protein
MAARLQVGRQLCASKVGNSTFNKIFTVQQIYYDQHPENWGTKLPKISILWAGTKKKKVPGVVKLNMCRNWLPGSPICRVVPCLVSQSPLPSPSLCLEIAWFDRGPNNTIILVGNHLRSHPTHGDELCEATCGWHCITTTIRYCGGRKRREVSSKLAPPFC